jgi:hypothetical protein
MPAAPRRVRRRVWALSGAAVAVAAVLAVMMGARLADRDLTYTVEGGPISEGGYVRGSETTETSIRFSDGTAVKFGAATRGRVASIGRKGARVMLEHGRAKVDVVHRPGAEWLFDAGPFMVLVTGTNFEMHWSPADQMLELTMHTGSIIVRGPPAPDGVTLRAGQRMVMGLRDGLIRLEQANAGGSPNSEGEPAPPEEAPTGAAAAAAAPGAVPSRGGPTPLRGWSSGEGNRSLSWQARIAAGDFSGVLADANRRGIQSALDNASASDLMALADAARYVRKTSIARKALLAQRTRFAGSPQAQKAAFLLGRLAEDQEADLAQALQWYDRYLGEAGGAGPYRSEALGRRMTATLRLSGQERARAFAEEYLRRVPNGPYADAARAILQPPE